MSTPKILHLTLKKQWFDMILNGEKIEEYRELKPYWDTRLAAREYDFIQFQNGYSRQCPSMLVELLNIDIGKGRAEWGAPKEDVYILKLGNILNKENCSEPT